MSELNGRAIDGGVDDYQPRHAAVQLDDEFLGAMISAADEYYVAQMGKEYEARYAIERARMDSDTSVDIGAQLILVAKSLGRQAVAREFAASLREQLYYTPPDGMQYHGSHRLEDRMLPTENGEEGHGEELYGSQPPPPIFEETIRASAPAPVSSAASPPPPVPPEAPPRNEVPSQGRLAHIIDEGEPEPPPSSQPFQVFPDDHSGYFPSRPRPASPPPTELDPHEPQPQPRNVTPRQREKKSPLEWMRHAWYAGGAMVSNYFYHPDKGRRRRIVTRAAAVAGAIGLALWLDPDIGNQPPQTPDVAQPPQPLGPAPNTEEFFDTIKPGSTYHGEQFEWTVAANNVGAPQATPKLLQLIDFARDGGLGVDTWGDPKSGDWGINSVTVDLPGGVQKTYYETDQKWAILHWYAGGMGPNQ